MRCKKRERGRGVSAAERAASSNHNQKTHASFKGGVSLRRSDDERAAEPCSLANTQRGWTEGVHHSVTDVEENKNKTARTDGQAGFGIIKCRAGFLPYFVLRKDWQWIETRQK